MSQNITSKPFTILHITSNLCIITSMISFGIIVKEVVNTIFPIKCVNCGLISKRFICKYCYQFLEVQEPECYISRLPSTGWEIKPRYRFRSKLDKVYYFYKYNDLVHKLILSIKYSFHRSKIEEVITLIIEAEEFQKINFSQIDLVTYVPITKKREAWRGFNQSKLIAEGISSYLQIPYLQILEKYRNTKAQIDLKREERLVNICESFRIKQKLPLDITKQHILIIDDICTTGSTLKECAKVIKRQYPNTKVSALCLARGK
jgi:competence protein ComFC